MLVSSRQALLMVSSPIQYLINWPYHLVDELKVIVAAHDALIDENQQLKAQAVVQQLRLEKLLALEQENKALRALLSSSNYVSNRAMVAQLLAVSSGMTKQEYVIDKGAMKNVYLGQAVIDSHGVIGQVVEVGPNSSRVMLLTDTRSRVPVESTSSGLRAIAQGRGAGLSLANIPKTDSIKEGEMFITSGLGGVFPQGYPVGTVNFAEGRPDEQFAHIDLTPAAKLNQTRLVLLLWSEPKKQQPPTVGGDK